MDIANILKFMYPDAIWSVGDDYSTLEWPEQDIKKPSLLDIESAQNDYKKNSTVNDYTKGLENFINDNALYKNYSSSISLVSYSLSTNELWKKEALSFIAWRDSVWNYVLKEQSKFLNGERPLITLDEFITEVPKIVWPV